MAGTELLSWTVLGQIRSQIFYRRASGKRRFGLRQLAERYSGTVGTGASGWDAQAERSMAMAAYAMTPVTTHRISVR